MSLYDNEENAIVNNPDQVSETPANLVNNNVDNLVSAEELQEILQYKKDGNTNESKLSPNPAGFGFTKQLFVDSLPSVSNAQPNTLYIVKVKNDGVVIGYRLYKFVPFGNGEDAHFITFGATPDLKLVNSPREQKAVEVNEPKRSPAKVFNGDVAIIGDLFINGRKAKLDQDIAGDVTIGGDLSVDGAITGDSIVENMTGYSYTSADRSSAVTVNYAGVCKNGNKITFVIAGSLTTTGTTYPTNTFNLGGFIIPSGVGANIIPNLPSERVGPRPLFLGSSYYEGYEQLSVLQKYANNNVHPLISIKQNLPAGTYYFRYEETFLLSDNLAA